MSATTLPAAATVKTDARHISPVNRSELMKNVRSGSKPDEMRNAAAEFASVFINQMFSVMNESVNKSDFGHGGKGEEFFQSMLYQEYSRKIAYEDSFGITEMIYKGLEKKQRSATAPAAAADGAAGGATPDAALMQDTQKLANATQAVRAYSMAGGSILPQK